MAANIELDLRPDTPLIRGEGLQSPLTSVTATSPLPHEGVFYPPEYIISGNILPFSAEANKQAMGIDISEFFEGREEVDGVSIDGVYTEDRDDAFDLEEDGRGLLLHVHIADPTAVIEPSSPIDLDEKRRSFARYFGQLGNDPMMPRVLTDDLLSLNQGVKRLTFTTTIPFSSRFIPGEPIFRRTVLPNRRAMTYPEADRILKENNDPESRMLRKARELAMWLADSSGREYDPEHGVGTSEEGRLRELPPEEAYWADAIIREFMIANNKALGRLAKQLEAQGIPQGYRTHTRADGHAFYTTHYRGHEGLGLDISEPYLHGTSPNRRRFDQLAHRQIIPAVLGGRPAFSDPRELEEEFRQINRAMKAEKDREESAKHTSIKAAHDKQIREAISSGDSLDGIPLGRVIKVAVRDGTLEKIWPWIEPKIAEGKMSPKILLPLLFNPMSDSFTRTAVSRILRQYPFAARDALESFCREREIENPSYKDMNSGVGNYTYRSQATIKHQGQEIKAKTAHGRDRKTARARASANLIRAIQGDPRFAWN